MNVSEAMPMKAFPLRRIAAATFAAAVALAGPATVTAEDVDIFTSSAGTGAKPNVLILLDNSSNWSATLGANECNTGNMADNTKFAAEICALKSVLLGNSSMTPPVPALPDNKMRMGLMMFAESGDNGAYVRFGMRNMDGTNKPALANMLLNMVANGSGSDTSGSNQPYAKALFEVFKYFGGFTNMANATTNIAGTPADKTHYGPLAFAGGADNSTGTARRDYRNNNTPANRAAALYNADTNSALANSSANSYTNPIVDDCAKNFLIVLSNGDPSTGGDSSPGPARDTEIQANLSVPAIWRSFPNASNEIHASKMDEMAYFLHQTDVSSITGQQRVITYTIAVYQPQAITYAADNVTVTSETIRLTDQNMIKLMKSAANLGGGKYFAARRASDIVKALLEILNEVQAVNSVFVSASLPVSVNNQGTFENQVYMGMFRPDGSGNPRWLGNLKEYKFLLDATTGALSLGDAYTPPHQAVNPSTGFISPAAWSFWTRRGNNPAGTGWPAKDFWVNSPSGSPPNGSDALDATHGDGEVVEKGGAGEMMRLDFATSQASRRVLTCLTAGCTNNMPPDDFNSTTITGAAYQAAFGVATAADLTLTVDWIRGQDNFNGTPCDRAAGGGCNWTSAEFGPDWPATVRPSIHGDVLHSRPVVINYPADAVSPDKGGPWVFYGANDGMLHAVKGGINNAITASDGHEFWSFIAPEFFSKMKRQRIASPELRTPNTDVSLIPFTLPKDYFFDGPIGVWEDPNSTDRWIFVTARRGGRVIYAFDVTDPTAPKFMWKKTATDLPDLGQTWSTPWAFKLTGDTNPTLVFGAGYDVGEDLTPTVANGTVGRGIYVLDAKTGIAKNGGNVVAGFMSAGVNASIVDAVPSDISLLVNSQGQVYRGFFGDMGGNIWRLDIPSNDVGTWRLNKFARFGAGKKFFFAPDVVHGGGYDVVLAGTGDREKPLMTTSTDSFYALNDVNQAEGVPASAVTPLTIADLSLLSSTAGYTRTGCGTPCICAPPACAGWYRNLATGEKVVNSPLTVAGTTYFSTNMPTPPAAGSCNVNLGQARAYGFTFYGGTPNKTNPDGTMGTPLTGGGLPPSPVGGVVTIEPGKNVAFIIGGGDKGSSVEGGRVTIPVSSTRRKVYWNKASDK
jgi:type IV pilus assembly protein PilY1